MKVFPGNNFLSVLTKYHYKMQHSGFLKLSTEASQPFVIPAVSPTSLTSVRTLSVSSTGSNSSDGERKNSVIELH